ncbi:RNA helicase, partial [Carbonactinospora thermoautotrophica]
HARWAERYWRLKKETDQLERRIQGRTNTIARTFDRVCAALTQLGYLDEADGGELTVTPQGELLSRLYTELDLLAAECLRAGLWDRLTPAELAACVSVLVYESRQPDDVGPLRLPGGKVRDTLEAMVRLWGRLDTMEKDHHLDFLREPDLGFAWPVYRWACGHRLEAVLTDSDLPAGDFVRWTKQVIDLLDQISDAVPDDAPVRKTAHAAVDALRRGVVAYSSVG